MPSALMGAPTPVPIQPSSSPSTATAEEPGSSGAPPTLDGYGEPAHFAYPGRILTVMSVVALPVAFVAVGVLMDLATGGDGLSFVVSPETAVPFTISVLLVFPVTIVLHEFCHGVVANLLGYRVTYGTSRIARFLPVAYAAAFEQPMSRRDNVLTAAAPLVVLTVLGTALASGSPDWLLLALGAGMATNIVGAVGDVYVLYRTARLPPGSVYYDVSIDEQYIYEPLAG